MNAKARKFSQSEGSVVKPVTITLGAAQAFGPRIVAQLRAGELVRVAGFLLRLTTADADRPELELTP